RERSRNRQARCDDRRGRFQGEWWFVPSSVWFPAGGTARGAMVHLHGDWRDAGSIRLCGWGGLLNAVRVRFVVAPKDGQISRRERESAGRAISLHERRVPAPHPRCGGWLNLLGNDCSECLRASDRRVHEERRRDY